MSDSLILSSASVSIDEDGQHVSIYPTQADKNVKLDRVEAGLLIRYLQQAVGTMQ